MALGAESYLQQLQGLLLQGKAWTREVGAVLTNLLTGFAQEFARVDARADDLLNEADPRTTYELLEDWERVAGLPDPCVTIDQTIAQRRIALESKLTMQGGQSRQYFIDLAESTGYPAATIDEFSPFICGENACGDALWSEADRFVWQLNLPSDGAIFYFRTGDSLCGEPLQAWVDEVIECRVNKFKPAHTHVVFAYK